MAIRDVRAITKVMRIIVAFRHGANTSFCSEVARTKMGNRSLRL